MPIIIITIIAIAILGGFLYYFEYYEAICYTRIDNTKIEKVSSSDEMVHSWKEVNTMNFPIK